MEVSVGILPYGAPPVRVSVPPGATKDDVLKAFREGGDWVTPFEAHSMIPDRLFYLDDGQWREVLRRDRLPASDHIELRFSQTTPPPSLPHEVQEGKTILATATPEQRKLTRGQVLAEARGYLFSKPGVKHVVLFGSYHLEPGTANDIDLAVESTTPVDPAESVSWAEELQDLLGRRFDSIVDLRSSHHANVTGIRSAGQYLSPIGSVLTPEAVNARLVTALFGDWNAMELSLTDARGALEKSNASPDGDVRRYLLQAVAGYAESFYQKWEDYATRTLRSLKIACPVGDASHADLCRLFAPTAKVLVEPCMDQETYDALDILRKFRHFSRKNYVLEYDGDRLSAHVHAMDRVAVWVRQAFRQHPF